MKNKYKTNAMSACFLYYQYLLLLFKAEYFILDSLPHSVFFFFFCLFEYLETKKTGRCELLLKKKTNLIYIASPEIILEYK